MSESDSIIVDTTNRIFQDLGDPQTVNNAKDEGWKKPLWAALEESGLTLTWVPDTLGGAGAEISDGFDVLRAAGNHAVAVPLAETMLAGWLLAQAGIASPPGPMTVAPVRGISGITLGRNGKLSGAAAQVPSGRDVDHIAVIAHRGDDTVIALVERSACAIREGRSLADEPKDTITFDGVTPREVAYAQDGIDEDALCHMGAAVRACQMAGALEAMLGISVEYAKERVAFERAIGKFQAVQHLLARLGGEVSAAVAVSASAADAIQRANGFGEHVFVEIASAKIRVGEAAGEGAAIAHQV
ncbi:MAG: acyl-CoA dehydrogenase family protein, partial [Geminicoccales bacterium]